MIAIIDYGVGNLFSLKASFAAIGYEAVVTGDEKTIRNADKLILPGVGAFKDAKDKLTDTGLDIVIKDEAKKGKPLLGICLGMQLLFDKSFEYGENEGLGLIKGDVVPLLKAVDKNYKIPHIGWNPLIIKKECALFKYINNGDCVYFVHSFYVQPSKEYTAATAEYDIEVTAAAVNKNIYGCQFHPEKSGDVGLNILRAVCEVI